MLEQTLDGHRLQPDLLTAWTLGNGLGTSASAASTRTPTDNSKALKSIDATMARLLPSVMGAFAEFERQLLKEHQREGIEAAKKKRAY
ncbi:recombinase family protein [Deinococcus terrestris]|uniref:recombinase family protein n=1 Tax=Deinococcus terrestris TaxID=2651870 RepID=UPI001D15AA8D